MGPTRSTTSAAGGADRQVPHRPGAALATGGAGAGTCAGRGARRGCWRIDRPRRAPGRARPAAALEGTYRGSPARPPPTPSASRWSTAPTPCARGRGGEPVVTPAASSAAPAVGHRRSPTTSTASRAARRWGGAEQRSASTSRSLPDGRGRVGPRAAPRAQRGRRVRRRRLRPGGRVVCDGVLVWPRPWWPRRSPPTPPAGGCSTCSSTRDEPSRVEAMTDALGLGGVPWPRCRGWRCPTATARRARSSPPCGTATAYDRMAGDSRAYWVDDAGAILLTVDHSWAQDRSRRVRCGGGRRATTPGPTSSRDGGRRAPKAADTSTWSPSGAGRLVLCTDGMWNLLDGAAELSELVAADDGAPWCVARRSRRPPSAAAATTTSPSPSSTSTREGADGVPCRDLPERVPARGGDGGRRHRDRDRHRRGPVGVPTGRTVKERAVVVVLDMSGSMKARRKLVAARNAGTAASTPSATGCCSGSWPGQTGPVPLPGGRVGPGRRTTRGGGDTAVSWCKAAWGHGHRRVASAPAIVWRRFPTPSATSSSSPTARTNRRRGDDLERRSPVATASSNATAAASARTGPSTSCGWSRPA